MNPGGIILPFFERRADLTATGSDDAGVTIGSVPPELGFAMRDASVLGALGASISFGHRDTARFPAEQPGVTTSWETENAAAPSQSPTTAQISLPAERVTAYIDCSDQFLFQGKANEAFVRKMLSRAVMEVLQQAVINGSGTSNQPTGILNTSEINTVAAGGGNGSAPTYEDLEYAVTGTGKSGPEALGWICSPLVRKYFRGVFVNGTGSFPVWGLGQPNQLLGYPAGVTTGCPDNLTAGTSSGDCSAIIFGKFSELFVAFYGPGVIVDAERIISSPSGFPGTTRIIARAYVNCGVWIPTVFAVKPDALCA